MPDGWWSPPPPTQTARQRASRVETAPGWVEEERQPGPGLAATAGRCHDLDVVSFVAGAVGFLWGGGADRKRCTCGVAAGSHRGPRGRYRRRGGRSTPVLHSPRAEMQIKKPLFALQRGVWFRTIRQDCRVNVFVP